MHDFRKSIESARVLIAEGSVIERLGRGGDFELDPHIAHAGFIYEKSQKAALLAIYQQYVEAVMERDLPLVLFTPTWRANPRRLAAAGFGDDVDVNGDGVRFIDQVRSAYPSHSDRIFIGGLMGCNGDAYQPIEALPRSEAVEFHEPQASALAHGGSDFLMAATLPAFSEAAGIAEAMARAGIPYIVSFVIRPTAELLDNTPLWDAILRIDTEVDPKPMGYLINCVHPSVFDQAMQIMRAQSPSALSRILGLQANTSAKSPEELDNADALESEEPEPFALAMEALHDEFGMKILGGCCGTDHRHIAAIARCVS